MLTLLHEQVRPIICDALLHIVCQFLIVALILLSRRPGRDLNNRFCELLHFHLDNQLLKVPLGTVILLLDNELTLGFPIALYLALKLVEAIDNVSLHQAHLFLQVMDQRVDTFLCGDLHRQLFFGRWCSISRNDGLLLHRLDCSGPLRSLLGPRYTLLGFFNKRVDE